MGLYMGGLIYGGGLIDGPHLRLMVRKHAVLLNFSNFKQKIIEYCHQRDAIIFIVSIISI